MAQGELWLYDLSDSEAAVACLQARRTDEGLAIIGEALARSVASGLRRNEAELHRLKGELLLRTRAPVHEAQDWFRRAIATAQRQQAKSLELRATTSLARLLRETGHRDEARTMLAEIYNWFTEGFDTADLKDAKALLDELAG
jgi:predicted ATPase